MRGNASRRLFGEAQLEARAKRKRAQSMTARSARSPVHLEAVPARAGLDLQSRVGDAVTVS